MKLSTWKLKVIGFYKIHIKNSLEKCFKCWDKQSLNNANANCHLELNEWKTLAGIHQSSLRITWN